MSILISLEKYCIVNLLLQLCLIFYLLLPICRDIAIMFTNGSFVIKGRKIDAIRFKILGDVIYPGQIEEVMSKHPAIANISVSVHINTSMLQSNY